ncbi:MAG: Uma2 family endonuclease [Selenomonadaceae bacterium]|nr:Uma2 family endonuclease [Selenomonadaceae bacterium]
MENTAIQNNIEEPEAYEIINGREIMMAAASMPHLDVQGNLYQVIKNYLEGKKCRVYSEAKVVFDEKNWLQPDILVICDRDKIKKNHIEGAPDFVAEILSPATQARDFNEKKSIYEKFGVPEYWIIDPTGKNVFIYLLKDDRYMNPVVHHLFNTDEWDALTRQERTMQTLTLKLSMYDDLEINLKKLFAR